MALRVQSDGLCHSCGSSPAECISSRFKSIHRGMIYRRTQNFDKLQLSRLAHTLNRSEEASKLAEGMPVPPAYHLVYFTPMVSTNDLCKDGTDPKVSPGGPFTRRMWVGGEMEFEQDNEISVGQDITESTTLESCDVRQSRQQGEIIISIVRKTFENWRGLALTERRTIIFSKEVQREKRRQVMKKRSSNTHHARRAGEVPVSKKVPNRLKIVPSHTQTTSTCKMKLDPITVFRYSALTFNSHMIHFSTAYAKDVEHHPELIIQAPLNLTLLLNFWRDNNAVASENITLDGRRAPQIKKLVYEVKTPVYVGEGYSLKLEQTSRRNYSTRVEKDGTVAMAILITTISEGTKL